MRDVILDTNIFVRFFVQDIEDQFQKARNIFTRIEKGELLGFVSVLVINEIIWILDSYYEIERKVYIPLLLNILALKNIKILEIGKEVIMKVLERMEKQKVDFTDIYLFQVAGSREIFSFDKDFIKLGRKNAKDGWHRRS